MNINQVFTPFSFYSDILLQNRFKPQCKKDLTNGLVSPNNRFLCFQFRRPLTGQAVTAFGVYDLNDNLLYSIPLYYIRSFSTADFDYFIYQGESLTFELACGEYYLKITAGSTYYSEVFEVKKFEQYFEPFLYGVINNGNFNTTDYWNVNNGTTQWGIANNKATHTPDGSINVLDYLQFNHVGGSELKFPIQTGKTIRIKFTLSGHSNGTLRVTTQNGLGGGVVFSTNGVHEFTTVVVNNVLRFVASTTFVGSVSEVSVFVVEDFENCDKIYLKWRNSCDLYNIKFSDFGNVFSSSGFNNVNIYNGYANELFLETQIGEPEYRPFQEEIEDNEFNKIATFKKDSKWFKLNTLSIAEFVSDALSIINRFDFVRIYDPYRDELHEVKELEFSNEWLFDACFADSELSWKDFDLIGDACCDALVVSPCLDCVEDIYVFWLGHDLPDPEDYNEGDILFFPANQPLERYWFAVVEIYKLIGGEWVLQENPPVNTLYCFESSDPYNAYFINGQYMYIGDGGWILFPLLIINLNPSNECQLIIKGFFLPGMIIEIFVNLNGGGYVSIGSYNSLDLSNGVIFTSPETTSYLYEIKATVKTLNCDYGETTVVEAGGGGGSPPCEFGFINYP